MLERSAVARARFKSSSRVYSRYSVLRSILLLGGTTIVFVGVGYYWLNGGRIVSIDDAYIRAAKLQVATDVSGIVASIAVHEGQFVAKGDVLFNLDPRQFEIAVAGAHASLADVTLTIAASKKDYQRMLHDTEARKAQADADQATFNRFANLVQGGGVTRADYDNARFKLAADNAAVNGLEGQSLVQLARLAGNPNIEVQKTPEFLQAQARLDEAQRQLDDTVIKAPFAGIVTQVDTIQPGSYLPAASSAFTLISSENVWVEGNPKETELTYVEPGNRVNVAVDAYPGRIWSGVVESIAPTSGSEFSVLPAQNSSGNWVKVVQRVPLRVRIELHTGDPDLRAGMSVVANIDTGHKRRIRDMLQ